MQYGVISASIGDQSGVVLPNTFSVYTNVKMFKEWIRDIVQSSGSQPTEAKEKVKFFCNFELGPR